MYVGILSALKRPNIWSTCLHWNYSWNFNSGDGLWYFYLESMRDKEMPPQSSLFQLVTGVGLHWLWGINTTFFSLSHLNNFIIFLIKCLILSNSFSNFVIFWYGIFVLCTGRFFNYRQCRSAVWVFLDGSQFFICYMWYVVYKIVVFLMIRASVSTMVTLNPYQRIWAYIWIYLWHQNLYIGKLLHIYALLSLFLRFGFLIILICGNGKAWGRISWHGS